jgi:phospholipase/lecithinase/hemolysin
MAKTGSIIFLQLPSLSASMSKRRLLISRICKALLPRTLPWAERHREKAMSFSISLPGFQIQIVTYLNSVGQQASADDLYVIWVGANDFRAGIEPAQTVANIKNGIAALSAKGARTFLVITLPDLSLTPQVKALGGATVLAAKSFVLATNVLLEGELPVFALLHQISIQLVDINAIFTPLVYNPGSFGFTNSTGPAYNPATGVVVPDPNDYVFWDGFHPTTDVHYIGAEFIFKAAFLRPQFHNFLSIR